MKDAQDIYAQALPDLIALKLSQLTELRQLYPDIWSGQGFCTTNQRIYISLGGAWGELEYLAGACQRPCIGIVEDSERQQEVLRHRPDAYIYRPDQLDSIDFELDLVYILHPRAVYRHWPEAHYHAWLQHHAPRLIINLGAA